jgi:transposase
MRCKCGFPTADEWLKANTTNRTGERYAREHRTHHDDYVAGTHAERIAAQVTADRLDRHATAEILWRLARLENTLEEHTGQPLPARSAADALLRSSIPRR